jgi:hypothetical protein
MHDKTAAEGAVQKKLLEAVLSGFVGCFPDQVQNRQALNVCHIGQALSMQWSGDPTSRASNCRSVESRGLRSLALTGEKHAARGLSRAWGMYASHE